MNRKALIAILLAISITLSAFTATLLIVHGHPPIPGVTVFINPAEQTVRPCNNFVIGVNIQGVPAATPITDYDFTLWFDSSLMSLVDVDDGGFLLPNVDFYWETFNPDPTPIDHLHCWAVSDDGGATGDGTLAIITFHCDGPGDWTFGFEGCVLSSFGDYYVPELLYAGTVYQTESPTHTYIDPFSYTVPICIPFPIYVMVEDVIDLNRFSLNMTYNTNYVDCIDIVDGGFLFPPTWVSQKTIDETTGNIYFVLESAGGVDGSGPLANITFHCTGAGKSILVINQILLYNSLGFLIPTTIQYGTVIQRSYWEPLKLQHLVELPYPYHVVDMPFLPPSSPEGYLEIKTELEAKGYTFDIDSGGSTWWVESFFDVYFDPGTEPFEGTVTSWWSANTLEDGTRACLLSAEMEDGTDMAMGFVTNLLPPDQIPGVDPYIIYNAEPYFFIDFYWWAWTPVGKIVHFYYWWHDSHNHPNWFWGPYWWWRTYVKSYYYPYAVVPYWRPWWGWWWHWLYCRHWYWWSSYFPYDP